MLDDSLNALQRVHLSRGQTRIDPVLTIMHGCALGKGAPCSICLATLSDCPHPPSKSLSGAPSSCAPLLLTADSSLPLPVLAVQDCCSGCLCPAPLPLPPPAPACAWQSSWSPPEARSAAWCCAGASSRGGPWPWPGTPRWLCELPRPLQPPAEPEGHTHESMGVREGVPVPFSRTCSHLLLLAYGCGGWQTAASQQGARLKKTELLQGICKKGPGFKRQSSCRACSKRGQGSRDRAPAGRAQQRSQGEEAVLLQSMLRKGARVKRQSSCRACSEKEPRS